MEWDKDENAGSVMNPPHDEWALCISKDGKSLYFESNRPGGYGGYDFWFNSKDNATGSWMPAQNAGSSINSPADESSPFITTDRLELYFPDYREGKPRPTGFWKSDLWVARRNSPVDKWSPAENLWLAVNSVEEDNNPTLSSDGRFLFFCFQQDRRKRIVGYLVLNTRFTKIEVENSTKHGFLCEFKIVRITICSIRQ